MPSSVVYFTFLRGQTEKRTTGFVNSPIVQTFTATGLGGNAGSGLFDGQRPALDRADE